MRMDTYLVFLATTGLVCLSPGPAALMVVARGMSGGTRAVRAGIAGIALANALYFALSATGVATLLLASHSLFMAIKWTGVAYLFWLGVNALRSRPGAIGFEAAPAGEGRAYIFRQALVLELSNPKALLYFAALLPPFVDPAAPLAPQMLVYGATCLALDVCVYGAYGWLGTRGRRLTASARTIRNMNRGAGVLLMLAGATVAALRA